jgi:hypothetical protein
MVIARHVLDFCFFLAATLKFSHVEPIALPSTDNHPNPQGAEPQTAKRMPRTQKEKVNIDIELRNKTANDMQQPRPKNPVSFGYPMLFSEEWAVLHVRSGLPINSSHKVGTPIHKHRTSSNQNIRK